jgi:hypothetical protein
MHLGQMPESLFAPHVRRSGSVLLFHKPADCRAALPAAVRQEETFGRPVEQSKIWFDSGVDGGPEKLHPLSTIN